MGWRSRTIVEHIQQASQHRGRSSPQGFLLSVLEHPHRKLHARLLAAARGKVSLHADSLVRPLMNVGASYRKIACFRRSVVACPYTHAKTARRLSGKALAAAMLRENSPMSRARTAGLAGCAPVPLSAVGAPWKSRSSRWMSAASSRLTAGRAPSVAHLRSELHAEFTVSLGCMHLNEASGA